MRARYYNPVIQRFVNVDPIRDELNWYGYVNGNPVNFIDNSGLTVYGVGISNALGLGAVGSYQICYVYDDYGNDGIMFSGGLGGGVALDLGLDEYIKLLKVIKNLFNGHSPATMVFPDMPTINDLKGAGSEIAICGEYIENSGGKYSGESRSFPSADLRVSFTVSHVITRKDLVDAINNLYKFFDWF